MTEGTKAHQRYKTKTGIIVPGVTTILNLLNKPALVYWAWNLGMQGEDYRKITTKAADIGTIAHYLVECHLKNKTPDLQDYSPRTVEQAQCAYQNFEHWWAGQQYKVVGVEIQLVSDEHLYGGTIDCIAQRPDGKYDLLDVKTSKGVYDEMKYQLAAYWHMWEENNPDKPLRNTCIIHLNKLTGDLNFHNMGNIEVEWEIFQHLRSIYHLQKMRDTKRRKDTAFSFRQVQ